MPPTQAQYLSKWTQEPHSHITELIDDRCWGLWGDGVISECYKHLKYRGPEISSAHRNKYCLVPFVSLAQKYCS